MRHHWIVQVIFICLCGFALTVSMKNSIADFFIGIAFLFSLYGVYRGEADWNLKAIRRYIIPIFIFFLGFFLLIFASSDIVISTKAFWRYFNRMFPFFIVLLFIKERKQLLILFVCAIGSLWIDNLYAIYQGIAFYMDGQQYIRAAGISGDVIALGGFLLIYLPIFFLLVQDEKFKKRLFVYLGLTAVGLVALVFNGTRIAWLVAGILLPLSAILYGKNIKKRVGCLVVLYLIAGGIAYQFPFIAERIHSFVDVNNISNQGHYLIKASTIEMIRDKPLLGHGLGFYPEVFNAKYISEETKRVENHISHAHNDTLLIWAETGIVGIILFWLMFGSFLFFSFKSWYKDRQIEDLMFFMVTLAAAMHGVTDTRFGMHQVMKMYFFLMAVYLKYRYSVYR